jgi:hypothetical protein
VPVLCKTSQLDSLACRFKIPFSPGRLFLVLLLGAVWNSILCWILVSSLCIFLAGPSIYICWVDFSLETVTVSAKKMFSSWHMFVICLDPVSSGYSSVLVLSVFFSSVELRWKLHLFLVKKYFIINEFFLG